MVRHQVADCTMAIKIAGYETCQSTPKIIYAAITNMRTLAHFYNCINVRRKRFKKKKSKEKDFGVGAGLVKKGNLDKLKFMLNDSVTVTDTHQYQQSLHG